MARRPRSAPVAPVTWRDGVHLTGTSIWCDARRRRDVCFVSSADRIGAVGHGQLVATPITLALLAARGAGHLAVPVHRPFTLGTVRLELIPSGRSLGAAALHVDAGGRTVLYAGPIRSEGAEVRAADAVVVAAPVAAPRLAPLDEVAGTLVAWVRRQLATGKSAVLVVDTASDGVEVATRLTADGLVVAGSRAVRDAALRLGDLAPVGVIRAPGREPCAVIRLDADRLKLADAPVALVSVRALDEPSGFAAVFAWPFVAGRDGLLAWIEHTRAREVFVTGRCAEAIVEVLGPSARILGPPRQMTLFPREAAR